MDRKNDRWTYGELVTLINNENKHKRMRNEGQTMRVIDLYGEIQKRSIRRFFEFFLFCF
jgi:hypothetical protein